MTEPQVWVLIAVFAAAMASMITLVITTINAKFAGFDGKLGSLERHIDDSLARASAELRLEMSQGFTQLERKLNDHDRDIQALYKRDFDTD